MREKDLGRPDATFLVVSHLGQLLQPGDVALGYDLAALTSLDADSDLPSLLPEAVLVAKASPASGLNGTARPNGSKKTSTAKDGGTAAKGGDGDEESSLHGQDRISAGRPGSQRGGEGRRRGRRRTSKQAPDSARQIDSTEANQLEK